MTALPLSTILIGGSVVVAFMFVVWLIHLPIKNASIVDVGWATSLGILAIVYALRATGDPIRAWTIATMAAIWSFRLAIHLLVRIVGSPEEGRYVQLRRDWGRHIELKFLLFFEMQAILAIILSTPFLLPTLNGSDRISPLEIAGVVVWLLAIIGETVADRQLSRFKADPTNEGEVCNVGLWRYSRHPNYFFEWLAWVGFAIFALPSPWGWSGLIAPALMLFFLLRVTGIPPTEKQSLRSRGEKYRRYQQTTNAFFPWLPKHQ